jgi:hypothetical protein
LVVAMQGVQLSRHEERLERKGAGPAHSRLQQRRQHGQDAGFLDHLPSDLQIGLAGGPATARVDWCSTTPRRPRSMTVRRSW